MGFHCLRHLYNFLTDFLSHISRLQNTQNQITRKKKSNHASDEQDDYFTEYMCMLISIQVHVHISKCVSNLNFERWFLGCFLIIKNILISFLPVSIQRDNSWNSDLLICVEAHWQQCLLLKAFPHRGGV